MQISQKTDQVLLSSHYERGNLKQCPIELSVINEKTGCFPEQFQAFPYQPQKMLEEWTVELLQLVYTRPPSRYCHLSELFLLTLQCASPITQFTKRLPKLGNTSFQEPSSQQPFEILTCIFFKGKFLTSQHFHQNLAFSGEIQCS